MTPEECANNAEELLYDIGRQLDGKEVQPEVMISLADSWTELAKVKKIIEMRGP